MTSCCNPHLLLLLVILLVLLLRGRGLKELLLLLFSRRHDYAVPPPPPPSIPPIPPPPIPLLFAADTWDDASDYDTDTSDNSGTVWDWFESLIEETVKKLVYFFVFFLLFLLFAELLRSKHSRSLPHPPSTETTSDTQKPRRFKPGRNPTAVVRRPLYPSKNRATPPNDGRSSSAISHRSFLKSFFAENSRQNCISGGRKCSLTQWLVNRKALGFGPLMEFTVPESSATVTYVRDDIKVLIRSLVEFLQDQHDRRYCVNGINVDDIFVDEQCINISNLKLVGFSEDIQKQDYYSLGIIIKRIIHDETKQVPYDMERFLKLFNNPMQYKNLFKVHVALMNRLKLRDIIILLGDKKKTLASKLHPKWKKAVEESSDIDDWSKLIDPRSPLYKIYCYKKAPNSVKKKQKASYDCRNKFDMIRFFRNAAAHLDEYSNRGKMFQLDDSALIILASFPKTIADLQERLNHHGILQEFVNANAMD